jgi:tetratricopeptide (TPR) repeat protein
MNAAIRQNPNYAPAYAGLSEAYLLRNVLSPEANWVSLARDSATKAVGLNPDLAVAHVALGNALSEAGRRKEAIAEFEHAKDLDPKSWAAVVGLADAASATGNKTEAETFYRKAMELAPDSWGPYKNYGTFLYSNQRYDEALTAWQHALRLTPDNVRLLRNEAAAYLMLSRYEDSASALQTALTIEPAAGLYTNLGILRFFQGRFSDAVPPFEKATQLAPTNYNNWGNLGDAYRWAPGMQAKAAAVYARAIDLIQAKLAATPDDPELRANLAGYLAKSERSDIIGCRTRLERPVSMLPLHGKWRGTAKTPFARWRLLFARNIRLKRSGQSRNCPLCGPTFVTSNYWPTSPSPAVRSHGEFVEDIILTT